MPYPSLDQPEDAREAKALKARIGQMVLRAKAAGLTQEQLGERVGTNQGAISKWERQEAVPTSYYLMRLIRACSRPGAMFDANWVVLGQGEPLRRPDQETPDEAYVRAGLTILARLEDAVEDAARAIRKDLLRAEKRLPPPPSGTPAARSGADALDIAATAERSRPAAAPRPQPRGKRRGS